MFPKLLYSISLTLFSITFAHSSTCHLPHPSISRISGDHLFHSENSCPYPPVPFIVKQSSGKGLGVFASHVLETGSIILREPPTIKIDPQGFVKGSGYPMSEVTKLVRSQYEHLPPEQQEEVISLTYHASPGEMREESSPDVLGLIFRTNAYNSGSQIGLFPKIARINHSCRPNAGYYWSETLNKRVIYATRDIQEGEEIFVSYISLLMSRGERQKMLSRYGFTCTCSACAQSPGNLSLSDKRRTDINTAFQAFEPQLTLSIPESPSSLRRALKNAASSLQLADLVEKEGLADYYAKAYRVVAISHARVEDWEKATVWANKGYERRFMEDPASSLTMEMHSLTSRFIKSWQKQLANGTQTQNEG